MGNPIDEHHLEKVIKGVTPRDQIVELLGAPEDIIVASDHIIAEYKWSTTRSASLNLGYFFRLVSPVSPSMTMSGTGFNIEHVLLTCDQQLNIRSYAFGKAHEHAFFEF